MLSFARRRELELAAVNVGELVNGMKDLIERSLGPMINLETDVPMDLPSIKADANQMETAILNLAVNARDAMPRGGLIQILGRVERCAKVQGSRALTGDCVVLSVKDAGDGMDETTLRRAMEPFFTTKGVGKGTGPWAFDGARDDRTARRSNPLIKQGRSRHQRRDVASGFRGHRLSSGAAPVRQKPRTRFPAS